MNSGDAASIDLQGHITNTVCLKDIIVLSAGEKVLPGDMESAILRDLMFDQVMVISEAWSYPSVLAMLNAENRKKFAAEQVLKQKR
ncbi:MAG: hypothetical protein H6936_00820 [Burkholderiales bacterium]|nr:hypothetical protein [Nitrosomonas sp.]MCP5273398.1 hypothetical protein [Burkholderiales bacterium]